MTPHTTTPVRVLLDLDGVFYDFVSSLRTHLVNTGHDAAALGDATQWNFFIDWGLTLEEFLAACHAGVDAGVVFRSGSAYPGSLEPLARLKDAGVELHAVTDRFFGGPGRSAEATTAWMSEVGMVVDSLTFATDKTSVEVDFALEDKPSNYDALDAAGVQAYLINRAYNQQDDSRVRVDSVSEFVDRVLEQVAHAA